MEFTWGRALRSNSKLSVMEAKHMESYFRIQELKDAILSEKKQMKYMDLRIQKTRTKTFYYIWEKQIMFNFNILSHFSNYLFSCLIIIPIEVIRYILLISLKYEQSLLGDDFNCPCIDRDCISRWWKVSKITNMTKSNGLTYYNKRPRYPYHCNVCHTCFDDRDLILEEYCYKCLKCSIVFCESCLFQKSKEFELGKQLENGDFLCRSCNESYK